MNDGNRTTSPTTRSRCFGNHRLIESYRHSHAHYVTPCFPTLALPFRRTLRQQRPFCVALSRWSERRRGVLCTPPPAFDISSDRPPPRKERKRASGEQYESRTRAYARIAFPLFGHQEVHDVHPALYTYIEGISCSSGSSLRIYL